MTTEPTPQALEIATQAWLVEWRRAWNKRFLGRPGAKECPVPNWEELAPADQHLMMKAVKAALVAAQPDNVAAVIARREG